ncbi:MAG: hypothetical protein V7739_17250 [Motiliproteus sp.]
MTFFERDILIASDSNEEFFIAAVCRKRRKLALVRKNDWFAKNSQYKKPDIFDFEAIESKLKSGKLSPNGCLALPAMMLKTDRWIENSGKDKWTLLRDRNYKTIQPIIEDNDLWSRYLFGESIAEEIKEIQQKLAIKSSGTIYRLLNRYVTFGSIKNSLLPISYRLCGNRTVYDKPEDNPIKRGRKTRINRHGQLEPCLSKSRGITTQDKLNILQVLKEHEINNRKEFKQFSLEKLHQSYQDKFESHIIIRTGEHGDDVYPWLFDEENRISKQQFYYHVSQLLSDEELLRLKLGRITFEKDKAVKTGLARDGIIGPGYCYAIDATVLDIYIRYPYNPRIKSCGRPILYVVVDVWSTCIVGYYIGFHGPDWVGAGEALYHSCINKNQWAKSIGWDLEEGAWQCHHVPKIIFGDNGTEYSEYNIKSMLEAEIGIKMMSYAPIFRGDAKSIVERIFGILNNTFIDFQPGYVHKEALRELPHAANDAAWEYRDLVIAIGKEIVHHNNNTDRLKLHNFVMARENIGITPQAIYDDGIKREMGGGRIIEDKSRLRFAFLREEEATVHGHCVTHQGLEYEYPNGEQLGIYGKAQFGKSYKIPVRITNSTVNYIWHRDDEGNIVELRLRDVDHWANNQLRENVMEKLEEYAKEAYRLAQQAQQERLQLNFEHDKALAISSAQVLKLPARKSMPSRVKEAKQVMAEMNHNEVVRLIRKDFEAGKLGRIEPTACQDIDEDLYANYASSSDAKR